MTTTKKPAKTVAKVKEAEIVVAPDTIVVPAELVDRFKELGVSNEEASALLQNFGVPLTDVGPILNTYKEIKVESADDTEQMQKARETRLTLKKIRTSVEHTRKDLKAEFLRKGDAIQAVANYIRDEIEPAEAYLQLQEDFIKVQEEKAKAERITERTEKLVELGADPSIYSLGDMSAEAFDALVTSVIDANEAKAAREKAEAEAEAKAEAERVAREKALAEENARLKAEQEIANKKAAEEREAAAAALAAEKAKADALAREAAEKAAQEAAEKAKAEQEAKEKAEAEAKAARYAAMAPDRDKIINFANGLKAVVDTRLPEVTSPEAKAVVESIRTGLTSFIDKIEERASTL